MEFLKRIFTNWWVLSLLALALFLVIFVVLLPLLVYAFEPWSVRLVIAALFISVWAALAMWRIFLARKASREIARSIETVAPKGEGAVLAERMRKALASLRSFGGKGGDYLYSRPWYVIIGAPGTGKTTALENSGLRFLTDGGAPSSVGGTRNISFIFADEAVLIDTAGRYTSQDSDTERDRSAWREFLQLLRKNRPLQPVNGVIVALGLDDLA
jgi:type VI secretion system protein ImpL